jgi:hypothetical protein
MNRRAFLTALLSTPVALREAASAAPPMKVTRIDQPSKKA